MDPFNIILPYFFGAPVSYFHLLYSVLFAISFDYVIVNYTLERVWREVVFA